MRKFSIVLILMLVVLATAFTLLSQTNDNTETSDPAWRTVIYDDTGVYVISAETVEYIPLPESAQNREPRGNTSLQLSPDSRYIVYSDTVESQENNLNLYILDLDTMETVNVEHPSLEEVDPDGRSEFLKVGAFSPDGSQVVASSASWSGGTMLVVDVASGEVVTSAQTADLFGIEGRNYALMPEWTEDGILLYPHCFPCEGLVEGYAWRWQPETGDITQTDIYYRNVFYSNIAQRLEGTNEILLSSDRDDYPEMRTAGLGYNVIQYLTPESSADIESAPVVYSNPNEQTPLLVAYWVADGSAYLIHNSGIPEGTLVLRDGTRQTLDLGMYTFIAGTPEGWLMHDDIRLYHYLVEEDGTVSRFVLPMPAGSEGLELAAFVAESPALGITLDGTMPQPVILSMSDAG